MNTKQCTILIIDDDLDLCRILRVYLGSFCQVEVGHSLQDAQSALASQPTLLLLDNSLPDGFGIEHIEEIKKMHVNTKVVIMTADEGADLRKRAIDAGAAYFLQKPFKVSEVKDIIPGLLRA